MTPNPSLNRTRNGVAVSSNVGLRNTFMRALVGSTFSVARAHHGFEHGTAVPTYRRSALAKSDSQSDEPTAEREQCSHAASVLSR
jgi:hypothetical protein